MRFEVTHHLSGTGTPTHTLTDAAGVTALLYQAASTGSRLHIRPCAPTKKVKAPGAGVHMALHHPLLPARVSSDR